MKKRERIIILNLAIITLPLLFKPLCCNNQNCSCLVTDNPASYIHSIIFLQALAVPFDHDTACPVIDKCSDSSFHSFFAS